MFGLMMLLPAFVDIFAGNDDWTVFVASSFLTCFIGGGLIIAGWGNQAPLRVREAFLLVAVIWVSMPLFGSIPFMFSAEAASFTNAYFEAMSGITTTGATIISDLEATSPGILLWRGILQWLGGIGILVMAISISPMLQIGGMQLFRMEFTDNIDGAAPRIAEISGSITVIYLSLTFLCFLAYYLFGMNMFDAVVHSLTTVATGGMATHNDSIGYFNNPAIEYVGVVFMILASLPFLLYSQYMRGNRWALFKDTQVRWFLATLLIFIVIMSVYQFSQGNRDLESIIRFSAFNVTSIMTGTGYATLDYTVWGVFASVFFFFIMFVGGCAGSTSCGIKIFRFQVIFQNMKMHIAQMLHPNGVFIPRYNGHKIDDKISASVMGFFAVFIFSFAAIAVILSFLGLDDITAISGAASAMANVGPGLGEIIGPSGNYAPLPDSAKWVLSAAMLLGRLEIFTILVLFTPRFWKY
ncbi:MAG: TrkH family potassium uptake protein [Rhizobiales bacterium]|nr:TrkH family potassium uptake protein [Hyphomicrobiales bacterium]